MTGRRSIWRGAFNSWAEASSAAALESESSSKAFDTERWLERQRYMLSEARVGRSTRHTNLPLLAGLTRANAVVDLGGGSGWVFSLLHHSNPKLELNYTVIEQKTSVNEFASNFVGDEKVMFLASEEIRERGSVSCEILYSNSALQYFPDNEFLIALLVMCTPRWILLDDIQASTGAEFFSMQHYYGSEIPCRFIDVNQLIIEIEKQGYKLKTNWEYPAAISNTMSRSLKESANATNQIGLPRSLLFEGVWCADE